MGVPGGLRTIRSGWRGQIAGYQFILAGIVLLALGLRLARLGFQPLWWDEGWSLYFATTDTVTMFERTAVDIHPPFYYLLLHAWIQLLGPSTLSVRLLSVLIGTATVPLLFVLGRRMMGPAGGLLAAFLLATSPFHVFYSQEVRMYSLVTLLGLAAFYSALRWQQSVPRAEDDRLAADLVTRPAPAPHHDRWSLVAYILAATMALHTQYYAAFLLLSLNLAVMAQWARQRRPARQLTAWLGAQLAVGLLFLPWVLYAGGKLATYIRFKVGVEQDPSMGLLTYLSRHVAAFTWGHAEGALAGLWWIGLIPPALLVLAMPLIAWRWDGAVRALRLSGWMWALTVLGVTALCGFMVNLVLPFNPVRSERLLLLALPAYLLLVAGALLILWRQRRNLAAGVALSLLLAVVLSLSVFYRVARYPLDDYRPVADRIRNLGLATDAILCVHPWQVGYFQAYIPDDDARPELVLTPRRVLPSEIQFWASDPALMAADLDALLDKHGRLWFPAHQAMGRVLEDRISVYLAEESYPVLSEWYADNTVLSFYMSPGATARPMEACADGCAGARFGSWLTLEEAAFDPGPLEAGWGIVATDLTWRVLAPPPGVHHIGLRLVGPTGHVWAQRDAPPFGGLEQSPVWNMGGSQLDRHGLLVPAGTPPGEYRLTLRVYQAEDVTVLPVAFEGGSGGELELGTLRVIRPGDSPPAAALTYEQELSADFGALQLLGYNIYQGGPILPGEAVEVELFWQALGDPGEDFLPRLQLLAGGRVMAELAEKPVAGTYPTAWWRAGELVRDPHALFIPAGVAPGQTHLALSLVRAANGQAVEMKGGRTAVELAEIEVIDREHRFEPTAPEHAQTEPFGPAITLAGYDLSDATTVPGSHLEVSLHWHTIDTPEANYHSFVHLLDAEDKILAQHDGAPGEGQLPTLGWLPAEYVIDRHSLYLPPELPPGEYRLVAGLYEPISGFRPGDEVVLDTLVRVVASP
ncbi:MAG: glycosyltransferase family 39 protein [Anaerolineae bacterium]